MPGHLFSERAADDRRADDRDLHSQAVDLESVATPEISWCVEAADLGLQGSREAGARDQAEQGGQEADIEGHQEMADGHQHRAGHDTCRASDQAVGDQAAQQRCRIGDSAIEAGDRRGQGLTGHVAVERRDGGTEDAEAQDVFDMARLQQVAGHVEHQQRLHAVVGEAHPPLGEGQEAQALGMAEEGPVGLRGGGGFGGAQAGPSRSSVQRP